MFINAVSSMLALYGVTIYTRVAAEPLSHFCIRPIKVMIQVLIVLHSIQSPLVQLFAWKVLRCDYLLSAHARSSFWLQILLIFECFLLAALSSWMLRPSKNSVFDRYHASSVFVQQIGSQP
ncbi:unnamed protein product [Soboliphyme baturini]|uniref:DUF1084 domain-containing protein n=1 Tax=Soboliphyme baturini TaxID=241478 RepID=A0A183IAJ5_9BILA|nr:unnamed protein product [Soboliphyme baturini]